MTKKKVKPTSKIALSKVLTADQLEWLKVNYLDDNWDNLAKAFNKQFKMKLTPNALRKQFAKYRNVDLTGNNFKDFTRDKVESSHAIKTKSGRYFVTGVMPVNYNNEDEYTGVIHEQALQTIVSSKDHEVILLPTLAHVRALQNQPQHYDPILTPHKDKIHTEVTFNQNLTVVDARILPQQKKPLTSLEDYTAVGSVIVAHPRQHMALFATGNACEPGLMASTGVLNYPSYQVNRIGKLAEMKHRVGGRIVEIKGDKFFQRKVTFDERGGFFDLDTYYHYSGNKKIRVKALRVGDIHFGHHNEELMQILFEMIELLQPEILIFDDAFDGLSVSHHLNMVDKILRPKWAYSIETEAAVAREQMLRIKKACPKDCKIYWTDANHNNFLMRYLKDRRYMNDEINFKLAHELQLEVLAGRNPLAKIMGLPFINYLGPNDNLFIEGIQNANHGHLGINGSKGSRGSVKRTAPKLSSAHSHSPFEDDDHDGIGHWSEPDHGYNKGAGTWLPTVLAIFPGGATQQYIAIKGNAKNAKYEWKL